MLFTKGFLTDTCFIHSMAWMSIQILGRVRTQKSLLFLPLLFCHLERLLAPGLCPGEDLALSSSLSALPHHRLSSALWFDIGMGHFSMEFKITSSTLCSFTSSLGIFAFMPWEDWPEGLGWQPPSSCRVQLFCPLLLLTAPFRASLALPGSCHKIMES